MAEQSSEKSGIDGRIGRVTGIIVALTALIGACFALISTFGEGYNKTFHAAAPPAGVATPPAPSQPATTQPAKTAPDTSAHPAPGTCRIGFVWREAVAGDHVCVVPDTRRRAAADNAAAAARVSATDRSSGPDTCIQGYVWREATQTDHTCVSVDTRSQTQADNREAAARVAGP